MSGQISPGIQGDKSAGAANNQRKQQAQAVDHERQLNFQGGYPFINDPDGAVLRHLRNFRAKKQSQRQGNDDY